MTAWAQSLIRISSYEVETLQKRLAEITARRASAEMRVAGDAAGFRFVGIPGGKRLRGMVVEDNAEQGKPLRLEKAERQLQMVQNAEAVGGDDQDGIRQVPGKLGKGISLF